MMQIMMIITGQSFPAFPAHLGDYQLHLDAIRKQHGHLQGECGAKLCVWSMAVIRINDV